VGIVYLEGVINLGNKIEVINKEVKLQADILRALLKSIESNDLNNRTKEHRI